MMLQLTLVIGLLLSGCASSRGFDRDAMHTALHPNAVEMTEQMAASLPIENPARPMPFRLAIYFVQRNFPPHHTIQRIDWISEDGNTLIHRLRPLQSERILTDSFLIVDPTIQGHDARRIRQAALRYGADIVMIVDGAASVDRYNNNRAAWYGTLIGAYLAPGTVSEALSLIDGSLWDVRTEQLYANPTAEGRTKTVGSAVLVEDRQVLTQAKNTALDEFGKRIIDELRRIKVALSATGDPSRRVKNPEHPE